MRIPTWRVLLTGGAVAALTIAAIGFVAAGDQAPQGESTAATATETGSPASGEPGRVRPERGAAQDRLRAARLGWGVRPGLHFARHLVHAEVTVTGFEGELIVLAFDHGTVQSVGGGSLTIDEAGGLAATVAIDDATIVYVGRVDGSLEDLTVGDEVFVQSRVDGQTLAKRILILPQQID